MPMIVKSSPALLQQAGNLTPLRSRRTKTFPSLPLAACGRQPCNQLKFFYHEKQQALSRRSASPDCESESLCNHNVTVVDMESARLQSQCNSCMQGHTHASCLPRKPSLKSAPSKSLRWSLNTLLRTDRSYVSVQDMLLATPLIAWCFRSTVKASSNHVSRRS